MFKKIDCKDCVSYPDNCKNYKGRKLYACSGYKLKEKQLIGGKENH